MFCQNCGNKISDGARFCGSCGKPITEHQKAVPASVPVKKSTTAKSVFEQVVTFVSIIGGFIIGKYLGVVIFLFIFAVLIGQWFPKWYMKRSNPNTTLIKWIVWSNVLTWLLPPLGTMTGFAALGFSNYFPNDSKKYKTLAIIGLVASFLNALSGILINL